MTRPSPFSRRIRRILSLLEQERRLLLSGQLDGLEALTRAMEGELAGLEAAASDSPEDSGMLDELRARASRNLALAEGSRRGLKTAARLVRQVHEGPPDLKTYSRDGGTLVLSNPRHVQDRRT